MNIETVKLPVEDLTTGMHVVKLDRPWLETPFKLQGFRITRAEELRLLKKYCKHVYVDIERGVVPPLGRGKRVILDTNGEIVTEASFIPVGTGGTGGKPARATVSEEVKSVSLPPPAVTYAVETGFEEELPAAAAALAATKQAVRDLMQTLKGAARADLEAVKSAAAALEDSVLRNPDPLLLLRTFRSDEPFSFRHCAHSAVLGITLARALGFSRQAVHELNMGVLLADVGKVRLPKELLQTSRRLDGRETAIIRLHVKYGVDIATEFGGLTPGTIEIIGSHHERFNGSGYPAGLSGGAISLAGRIAGLVDSFDALTSERGYSFAIPIHEALQELYASPVNVFQRDLVEKLIQVLGTFPAGSLVELSDGSVALVVAQNPQRRLLPNVIPLTDERRNPVVEHRIVDLAAAERPALTIKDVLDPATCGVARPTAGILSI